MSDNFPILYRNIMDGLPSDIARSAFLWAVERPGEDAMCYRAEAFAREVHDIFAALGPMFTASAKIYGQDAYDPDIMRYISGRHANMRYGGNVAPGYA